MIRGKSLNLELVQWKNLMLFRVFTQLKMNVELMKFHKSCKSEFKEILRDFNILFYGYGCKEAILTKLFPDAKQFNMWLFSPKAVAEDLLTWGIGDESNSTIRDIDEWLRSRNKTLTLILFNFSLENKEFSGLKNIKLIGTIESIDFSFELDDLVTFNFILRDLTTFENYVEETINIELYDSRVQNALLVLKNLPAKTKLVFKRLLGLNTRTTATLFEAVKKELFLVKYSSLLPHLHEFIDHKIIKINESKITVNLTKDDIKALLENRIFNS